MQRRGDQARERRAVEPAQRRRAVPGRVRGQHGRARRDVERGRELAELRRRELDGADRQVDDHDAHHQHRIPEQQRDRQPHRQQAGRDAAPGQDHVGRAREQLVRDRVEHRAEPRDLAGVTRHVAVERVGERRDREHHERPAELAPEREHHEHGHEAHAQHGELVGDREYRLRHGKGPSQEGATGLVLSAARANATRAGPSSPPSAARPACTPAPAPRRARSPCTRRSPSRSRRRRRGPTPPTLTPPPLVETPSPLADSMISPVVASIMRTVTVTSLLAFLRPRPPITPPPNPPVAVLLVGGRELRDRARDDVLHAEHLAHLRELGRARIGPIALREVLLGEDRVELLALDHAEAAVVDQLVDDLIGHALADVVVAPDAAPPVVDGAVVEVHHGDTSAASTLVPAPSPSSPPPQSGRLRSPKTSLSLIPPPSASTAEAGV